MQVKTPAAKTTAQWCGLKLNSPKQYSPCPSQCLELLFPHHLPALCLTLSLTHEHLLAATNGQAFLLHCALWLRHTKIYPCPTPFADGKQGWELEMKLDSESTSTKYWTLGLSVSTQSVSREFLSPHNLLKASFPLVEALFTSYRPSSSKGSLTH